ncbi:MAG: M56 family metallopeptidase, partial [Candidatus Eremiobacteraeota bacterium]|nr:M56 family metallopeptidase [Candidatus Eremiobacteraeota bacterium]
PGGLLLALSGAALVTGFQSACLQTPQGRIIFAVVWTALIVSLVRAVVLALRRHADARSLIAAAQAPTHRLRLASVRTGIATRELPDTQPFCALAGVRRPVVVISSGTIAELDDAELDAALLHERGHARRGDQVLAALLSFFVDLLPLPATDLVAMYREAREFAADEHALQTASPDDLAGALLAFARGQRAVSAVAALPGETGIRRRLHLLLERPPSSPVSLRRRLVVALALLAVTAAGLAPAGASILTPIPCQHQTIAQRS